MAVAGLTLGFIAVIGGLTIGTIATVLQFRHERHKLEHAERMRAFDLGRELPHDGPSFAPAKLGVIIATVVPIGVFVPAWLTTRFAGYHETIWIAAAMVGLASVICGSILAGTSRRNESREAEPPMDKPYVEEDAYDVVSSRG